MPFDEVDNASDLGVGVGLRTPHYGHILANSPRMGWFEIITENFFRTRGRPRCDCPIACKARRCNGSRPVASIC